MPSDCFLQGFLCVWFLRIPSIIAALLHGGSGSYKKSVKTPSTFNINTLDNTSHISYYKQLALKTYRRGRVGSDGSVCPAVTVSWIKAEARVLSFPSGLVSWKIVENWGMLGSITKLYPTFQFVEALVLAVAVHPVPVVAQRVLLITTVLTRHINPASASWKRRRWKWNKTCWTLNLKITYFPFLWCDNPPLGTLWSDPHVLQNWGTGREATGRLALMLHKYSYIPWRWNNSLHIVNSYLNRILCWIATFKPFIYLCSL